jgi:hypothetical protein
MTFCTAKKPREVLRRDEEEGRRRDEEDQEGGEDKWKRMSLNPPRGFLSQQPLPLLLGVFGQCCKKAKQKTAPLVYIEENLFLEFIFL